MQYIYAFRCVSVFCKQLVGSFAPAALLAGMFMFLFTGCSHTYTFTAEHGDPIDNDAVSEIVVGETTRSDIFTLLGPPHSIFHGQAEFVESVSVGMYSHRESRYLDTFGEGRYGMFYRFSRASDKATMVTLPFISWKNERVKTDSEELLFILDSNTNIVEDVAYRKAPSRSAK